MGKDNPRNTPFATVPKILTRAYQWVIHKTRALIGFRLFSQTTDIAANASSKTSLHFRAFR